MNAAVDLRQRVFSLAELRGFPRMKHPSPPRPETVMAGREGWGKFTARAAAADVAAIGMALERRPPEF